MSLAEGPAARAMRQRQSESRVDGRAPDDAELLRLLESAATVADLGALQPWRVIALRGGARERLGAALADASGAPDGAKLAAKPLRAPLLLAVVVSPRPSPKAPEWEQEAVAAGVAHALTLLLDEAGWGAMWRTGPLTRSEPVARMHDLAPGERLLGWIYVGGRAPDTTRRPRRLVDVAARYRAVDA